MNFVAELVLESFKAPSFVVCLCIISRKCI